MFYLSSSFLVLKHQEEQLNAEQQSLLSMTFCPIYIKKFLQRYNNMIYIRDKEKIFNK